MEKFELRKVCNALMTKVNGDSEKKNLIRLSIDIKLPDLYQGTPDSMFDVLQNIIKYFSNKLVNGLVNVELSLLGHHNNDVNIHIMVCGQGNLRTNGDDRKLLAVSFQSAGILVSEKVNTESLCFEWSQSFHVAEAMEAETKLPFLGKKILIAEDNEINAMVFSSFLEEWGCEVTAVVNGVEAVSQVHDKMFDAVLMDIYMPLLNGIDATKKIREFSDVPIIALTASTHETDITSSMGAGATDYLLKPVSSAHLFQVLSKYL